MTSLRWINGAAVAMVLLAGCENSGPERDFERMVNQSYFQVYKECDFFPDRRAMRDPPSGTLPVDRMALPPELEHGLVDNGYVEKNPVLLTPVFVEMGRRRFEVFCAPCHGVLGNGNSVVAGKMSLRRAPSLVSERVRAFPDGKIYRIVALGQGLMPAYAQELTIAERWAAVAYVRALSIQTQGTTLDRLPPAIRREAEEALQ